MVPFYRNTFHPSKETPMLSNVKRLVIMVVLPAGLALLLCTQTAHAQRRGTLQRQNSFSQGRCGSGQTGTQSQLSTGLQPQLSLYYLQPPISNSTQQLNTQALATSLQQQYALNALQQYVYEAQLTGTDPNEALQSALLAIQLNQRNGARLRAAQQNR
jgi:hypothetical protein